MNLRKVVLTVSKQHSETINHYKKSCQREVGNNCKQSFEGTSTKRSHESEACMVKHGASAIPHIDCGEMKR